jgi:aldehyde dehydrogenase (NAD+)/betaine-aldehyde dehydrogenase
LATTVTARNWTGIVGTRSLTEGEVHPDIDPGTGEVIAQLTLSSIQSVDDALNTARSVFDRNWSKVDLPARADLLRSMSQRILDHSEELARLESLDTGKPIREARVDAWVASRYFRFYANCIETLGGEALISRDDLFAYTLRQPIGVTAHIIPWNYPLQIASRSITPSLAAGNCLVLKPSTEAPLTSIRLGELALEAGFPPGVVNVVLGRGGEVGAHLAGSQRVGKISFTGSLEIGRVVAKATADNVVPATLELGGKSANVVFADADLSLATPVIANSILQNCGQSCVAGSRLIVDRAVEEELVGALAAHFRSRTLGHGVDDPDVGPLISEHQRAIVSDYVNEARSSTRLVCGGERPRGEEYDGGFYYRPTILSDVDPKSRLAQEEVFGPVLAVTGFSDEDDAIELANATEYGLAGAIWTRDLARAHASARRMEAGTVYINGFGVGGGVEMPSGGFKKSGYGREKGFEAIREFTQLKSVQVRL